MAWGLLLSSRSWLLVLLVYMLVPLTLTLATFARFAAIHDTHFSLLLLRLPHIVALRVVAAAGACRLLLTVLSALVVAQAAARRESLGGAEDLPCTCASKAREGARRSAKVREGARR